MANTPLTYLVVLICCTALGCSGGEPHSDANPVDPSPFGEQAKSKSEDYGSSFRPSADSHVADAIMREYQDRERTKLEQGKLRAQQAEEETAARQREYERRIAEERRRRAREKTKTAESLKADQEYASMIFEAINLQPEIHLSRKLIARGATAEIVGRDYNTIVTLKRNRDWPELTRLLLGRQPTTPPSYGEVVHAIRSFLRKQFQLLVTVDFPLGLSQKRPRTSDGPLPPPFHDLCVITFPVHGSPIKNILGLDIADEAHRFDEHAAIIDGEGGIVGTRSTSEGTFHEWVGLRPEWSRHPDGIGYYRRWFLHPDKCRVLIVDAIDMKGRLAGERNQQIVDKIAQWNRELSARIPPLIQKYRLGEIDKSTLYSRADQHVIQVFREAVDWAQR